MRPRGRLARDWGWRLGMVLRHGPGGEIDRLLIDEPSIAEAGASPVLRLAVQALAIWRRSVEAGRTEHAGRARAVVVALRDLIALEACTAGDGEASDAD